MAAKDRNNQKPSNNIKILDFERFSCSWKNPLGTLSGATLIAFFTRLLCPSCWPMYAGILSSVGLGFLMQKAWLMPLTVITLLFVVASLAYRANTRRGFAPFALGLIGSVALLSGQFIFSSLATGTAPLEWVVISKWSIDVGAILLITASVWNGWPIKLGRANINKCSSCMPKISGT